MHIESFLKEREKAEVVQPEVEAEKGPLYDVVEVNRPNVFSLLGLIRVIEKERK